MHRLSLLFLLCLIGFQSFPQQFEVLKDDEASDTIEVHEYWQSRYYDSIPSATYLVNTNTQTFEQLIAKYQEEDFVYSESVAQKMNFIDTILNRIMKLLEDLFPKSKTAVNKPFFYILGAIGAVIFLFLVYKLIFNRNKLVTYLEDEEIEEEEQVQFVERNLMHVRVQDYISEALKKENFPLAIRYQQLLNIQALSRKGVIDWKHTKTNMELSEEIDNEELKRAFQESVAIFNHVWFGKFPIGKKEYDHYAQVFQQFQRKWA